jgi:4-amino-4-deoxy-L-arabinose transferase-like glycosyltransferase
VVPASLQNNDETDYNLYYLPVAKNIVNGQGLTLDGKPALGYPPGYPVILAATLFIVKKLHCNDLVLIPFCLSLCALLFFFMAKTLWDPPRALLASIAWCLYPFIYWVGIKQASEIPFLVFFHASMLCFLLGWRSTSHKKLYFFAGGALCGISMLVRPFVIGVGVLIALLMLFRKNDALGKRVVFAACVILGNVVAVLPWEAWVYHKTHEVVLLCKSRDSISILDGLTFAVLNPFGSRQGTKVPADVEKLMKEIATKYSDTTTGKLWGFLMAKFQQQPVTVAKLFILKTVRAWYGTNTNKLERIIQLFQLVFMALLSCSCFIFWRNRPKERFLVVGAAALLCYYWGMTIMVLSIVRYLVPILGVLLIFIPALTTISFSSFFKKLSLFKQTS